MTGTNFDTKTGGSFTGGTLGHWGFLGGWGGLMPWGISWDECRGSELGKALNIYQSCNICCWLFTIMSVEQDGRGAWQGRPIPEGCGVQGLRTAAPDSTAIMGARIRGLIKLI